MKWNTKYLLSPIFVVSLALLLLNDLLLKDFFHNTFTGKLSDFSGIIVLTLFVHFINDRQKWINLSFVALFFIFWKSSISESLIDSFNALGVFHIGRIVDYWDLLALSTLPLLSRISFPERSFGGNRIIVSFLSLVTVCALTSTSRLRNHLTGWDYAQLVYEFSSKLSPSDFITQICDGTNLKLAQQDSIYVDNQKVNSFLFVHDPFKPVIFDSCRITLIPKNKRKLNVQVISLGIGSTSDLNSLDLTRQMNKFQIAGKIHNSYLHVTWK
jgi:hypothetical protein